MTDPTPEMVMACNVVAGLIEQFGYDPVWARRLRGDDPKEAYELFDREIKIALAAIIETSEMAAKFQDRHGWEWSTGTMSHSYRAFDHIKPGNG